MSKPTFVGLMAPLTKVTSDPTYIAQASGDSSFQEIGSLLGQAYERPQHAVPILESSSKYVESLMIRARVANEVLAQAKRDLLPPVPTSKPPARPTSKPEGS